MPWNKGNKITGYEKMIRERLRNDFLHYAQKCLKIRGKKGRVDFLYLNPAQKIIHEKLERQIKKSGKVRALILKGRQQGCSTYVQARFYWKLTHSRGIRAFVMAHVEAATQNMHKIIQRFYHHTPELMKPHMGKQNKDEIQFDKLDTSYVFGSAQSSGLGRSETIQFFHGSEVAYWRNASEHLSGVLQSIPNEKNTEIILESTPAGPAGLFYKMCDQVLKGESDYQLIFVPWFIQTEYKITQTEKIDLSPEEQNYQKLYALSKAQIMWRRHKIMELGGIHKFRQEYPASIEEAFYRDAENALWQRSRLNDNRISRKQLPELIRIVVAIDPAISKSKQSDETGIIVAGRDAEGHAYILEDLSGKYSPAEWAHVAVQAYHKFKADRIVAEVNQGGDMVKHVIFVQDCHVAYKAVHASRGKYLRAEPIAALDERGLVHHVGHFTLLEDQLCAFDPVKQSGSSPDRVDARVWALTELMLKKQHQGPVVWKL